MQRIEDAREVIAVVGTSFAALTKNSTFVTPVLLPKYPEFSELELEIVEKPGDLYASTGRDYALAVDKYRFVFNAHRTTSQPRACIGKLATFDSLPGN